MVAEPLISVIVPVYKVEQYLNQCVQSIVKQTYTNLEIILVDDGSPDRCPEMCDEYARQDARIKVVHKKNGGLSSARNAGLEIATGEYIGFVDSDDYIALDMYETLLRGFLDNGGRNVGIVSCQVYEVKDDSISIYYSDKWHNRELEYIEYNEFYESFFKDKFSIMVWNKLYLATLAKSVKFMNGRNNEDSLFHFQLAKYINQNYYSLLEIPYIGYYYRFNLCGIRHNEKVPLELDILRNDKFYLDTIINNRSDLVDLAKGHYVRDLISFYALFYSKPYWHKYLFEIRIRIKECSFWWFNFGPSAGIRHKVMYIVIWYFPALWRVKMVREFCTRRGLIIPW